MGTIDGVKLIKNEHEGAIVGFSDSTEKHVLGVLRWPANGRRGYIVCLDVPEKGASTPSSSYWILNTESNTREVDACNTGGVKWMDEKLLSFEKIRKIILKIGTE